MKIYHFCVKEEKKISNDFKKAHHKVYKHEPENKLIQYYKIK